MYRGDQMYNLKHALFIIAFALSFSSYASATSAYQAVNLRPGDDAPLLNLRKLLQSPPQAKVDKESLRNNVVVLEFWATWCAPCIAAIPHLNELAVRFKDKPVRFISITPEDEDVVVSFLKRRLIKTWIGLDASQKTQTTYSAESMPKTILIDAGGKIAAIMEPKQLTEEMLNSLLNDKSADIPQKANSTTDRSEPVPHPEYHKNGFSLTIQPIQTATKGWNINEGMIKGQMNIGAALSLIYGVSRTRIVGPSFLWDRFYEISASMTEGNKAALNPIIGRAIEAVCRIKTHRETREMEVYVLSAPTQNEIKLRPNTSPVGHSSNDEGVLAASAVSIAFLTSGLEGALKEPVIDETGLKEKYDWDIIFDAKNPQSIAKAIHDELGLELKSLKRAIEILYVEQD
jgi:uncharacterized protein (TIGR03435 family)